MAVRSWIRNRFAGKASKTHVSADRRGLSRQPKRTWPRLESLEDRLAPAITTFSLGVLTVDLNNAGEEATLFNDGANISLFSNNAITGDGSSFATASVTKLVVTDAGNNAGQRISFAGNYSLSGGLDSTGVERNSFSNSVTATGAASISVTAPQNIVVFGNLTGGTGGTTLLALGTAPLNTDGVEVLGGAVVTATGGGAVSVTGTAGSGPGAQNVGVMVVNPGSKITSGGGNVSVRGTGGSGADNNWGVLVSNSGQVTSGGSGTVSVTGTGGVGDSNNDGVRVSGSGQVTSGGSGSVTVTGTGGTGIGGNQLGVHVLSQGTITSGGGAVSVTGQGGDSNPSFFGSSNFGVLVAHSGQVTSGGSGPVTVTGTGGTSRFNSDNFAVYVLNSAAITSGSNAPITVTANSVLLEAGTINSGSGTTTIQPRTAGTSINLGGAKVIGLNPPILALTDAELDLVTAGTLVIGRNDLAIGTVRVLSAVAPANATRLSVITARDIVINANLTGGSGGLSLSANQQTTPTAADFDGVTVAMGAVVTATGSGPVTVTGRGGSGSGTHNYGVRVTESGSTITSGGGDVMVTGQGGGGAGSGGANFGVSADASGTITAGGGGTVTVQGTGGAGSGNSNYGVYVTDVGSTITSGGGAVQVTGQGGGGVSSNYGVVVIDGTITAGGGGTVTVQGTGGAGSGNSNNGVVVIDGTITAGGGGTVTVQGTGGAGSGNSNYGVLVAGSGNTITSGGGAVQVTGQGGGGSGSNLGVFVSGTITAGGGGTVTVRGTGGSGSVGFNFGVYAVGGTITSGGGAVQVTGQGGGGLRNHAVLLESSATITTATNGGSITVRGDSMELGGGTINAGSNTVTLTPKTTGTAIDLGGADATGTLGLTDAELDTVTAGTLVIGRNDATGALTISRPINRAAATNLTLVSPAGTRPNASGTDLDLVGGALTFGSGSALAIPITAADLDTGYEQLNVNGTVDLTGVDLLLSGDYVPATGDTFTLVNATNRLGTFNGLANGDTVTFNGRSLLAAYDATTMSLTVINDAPTANNDTLTVNEDAQATPVDVLANDSAASGPGATLTVTAVTSAAHGTVLLSGGVVTYRPNADYNGSDSFTYTIDDGNGGTATATVHVTVLNLVDLSGRVFDDANNDGLYVPADGDAGIGGVSVQLFNQTSGALIATRTTAADGAYSFDANLGAGTYRVVAGQPAGFLDGRETAGNLGGTVNNGQDSDGISDLVVGAPGTTADATDYLLARIRPSQARGMVWRDLDNNGEVDSGETGIAGVAVELTGLDERGQAVNRTATTDANGVYTFLNLRPSNAAGYTIHESQPAGYVDGFDTLGTVNGAAAGGGSVNDTFSAVVLPRPGSAAEGYNFGERLSDGGLGSGQTAGGGFWQTRKGQSLIEALNGGATATQLGNWLAATFPNLYGASAGASNLAGKTNAQVAGFYQTLFARTSKTAAGGGPAKMDAQVLATALAVYVTNETLAGTTASGYGFVVTATGVGASTFNVGGNGAAFGVANNANVAVLDLLLAVNSRARNGLLYDLDGDGDATDKQEKSHRTMANTVFSGINEGGSIGD